jgi:hypothetical protein
LGACIAGQRPSSTPLTPFVGNACRLTTFPRLWPGEWAGDSRRAFLRRKPASNRLAAHSGLDGLEGGRGIRGIRLETFGFIGYLSIMEFLTIWNGQERPPFDTAAGQVSVVRLASARTREQGNALHTSTVELQRGRLSVRVNGQLMPVGPNGETPAEGALVTGCVVSP